MVINKSSSFHIISDDNRNKLSFNNQLFVIRRSAADISIYFIFDCLCYHFFFWKIGVGFWGMKYVIVCGSISDSHFSVSTVMFPRFG